MRLYQKIDLNLYTERQGKMVDIDQLFVNARLCEQSKKLMN